MSRAALLLGCGYTAERVARLRLARGGRVLATTRDPARLAPLAAAGAEVLALDARDPGAAARLRAAVAALPAGVAVLSSLPPVDDDRAPGGLADPVAPLLAAIRGAGAGQVARVVVLSSTSVYGASVDVDETTPAAPRTGSDRARLAAEAAALGGPWSGLAIRPAAIYGPWRGLHASLRAGRAPPLDPDRPGSRIHADDLAALCDAALDAGLAGAYPAADELPATPREVAALCAALGIAVPPLTGGGAGPFGSRRVDGRALCAALGVRLRHPTFREGIPAALAAEAAAGA